MTGEPRSPTAARLLLGLLTPGRYRDNQLGDLEEEFRSRGHAHGWRAARRWYWQQALLSLPGSGRLRFREERDHDKRNGGAVMERWFQDFKYSVRSLAKSPQHAIIATVTLALAIGVNTAIFSLVSQVLFIDLPMEDPDELYWVWGLNTQTHSDITSLSLPNFQDIRERTRTFESLGAMVQRPMILSGVDQPERILTAQVTANLTEVWGDPPALGRGFIEGEDLEGAPKVVMLTQSLWENRFGSDPGVLGQTIRLDDIEHTIVGVASRRMETGNLGRARVWVPMQLDRSGEGREIAQALVTGRLAPGVTLAEARTEISEIGQQLADEYPAVNGDWVFQVRTTDDSILGDAAATILAFLTLTVGLVLLIACANVANLVLVRASSRTRELAVRSALGAGRARIVRQLLLENLLLALAAGGIGVGLAQVLLRGLVNITRGREPIFTMATIDNRVLAFTLLVSVSAPLIFGLLPALSAVKGNVTDALRDGDRAGSSRAGGRTRSALVVSQVALALSLMIMSGVMARSVIAMQKIDMGFEADGVMSMVIDLPDARYGNDEALRFFEDLEARLEAASGVRQVALAGSRPSVSAGGGTPFAIEGRSEADPDNLPTAFMEVVTNGYFDLLGVGLVEGRPFDRRDGPDGSMVAMVSREAVERFWPDGDVIGRRIRTGTSAPWREIVGVAENVAGGNDLQNLDVPQIYVPFAQAPRGAMVVFARSTSDLGSVADFVRQEVWAIDPTQPIDDVRSMNEYMFDLNSVGYAMITLFMVFAVFALAMAAMGIYGVMSFMVSERTREIGLRMALGAERSTVMGMILSHGAKLMLIGSVLGVGVAFLLSRMTAGLLYGVEPTDPVAFIGVPVLLAAIALVANIVPARRATRIDPMRTLRGH